MVEKLSAQQLNQLNSYLKANPKVSRQQAIKLLFKFDLKKTNENKGLTVEKTNKNSPKVYTLILKTKNGNYNVNKVLGERINNISTNLKKAEQENGFLGKTWSGFKNLTGIGDSSNKVREQLAKEKKLLVQFNSNPQNRAKAFEQLTGVKYSKQNLEKFIKGQIKLKSEQKLAGYKEGQEMAVDVGADIVSGIAAVGIYSAAVAAAPFTGGASIAVGVAAAGVGGAAIKTGLKAADAATGGRKYSLKDAGHDAATGAFSGVIAPITGGMGGAVGKTVATKLGIQAVKTVGKEVAEEVVETGVKQGLKQGIKTALTNPAGYEYVGGNIAKRGSAMAAEMASDGALGGALDNSFRAALDGGGAGEILQAGAEGFVGGAIMSPVIGGGFKVTGKVGHEIGSKIKGSGKTTADAVETSVVKNTDNASPTPKPQGASPETIIPANKKPSVTEQTVKSEPTAKILSADLKLQEGETIQKSVPKPLLDDEQIAKKLKALKDTNADGTYTRFKDDEIKILVQYYKKDPEFFESVLNKKFNLFDHDTYEFGFEAISNIMKCYEKNDKLTKYLYNAVDKDGDNIYYQSTFKDMIDNLDKIPYEDAVELLQKLEKFVQTDEHATYDSISWMIRDKDQFNVLTFKMKDS